jgi:hypothetical protein
MSYSKTLYQIMSPDVEAYAQTQATAKETPPQQGQNEMPCPCTHRSVCAEHDRCADKQLACLGYRNWITYGRWKKRGEPNRAYFLESEKNTRTDIKPGRRGKG